MNFEDTTMGNQKRLIEAQTMKWQNNDDNLHHNTTQKSKIKQREAR